MSTPEVVFALAREQNAFFGELAEALVFELGRLGATARTVLGEFPEQRSGSVTVLMPPHEYAAVSGVRPTPAMLHRCVLISAEQPSSEFFKWNVGLARDAGAVLDINVRAVRSYREAGIAADYVQLGYCEVWDRRRDSDERDLDVLFMGRATPRRERALALYADVLERFNCEFLLSDDSRPNSGNGVNFRAGEEKLELLSRAKVVLNIHGEGEPYFEWLRMAEAISCGCAVVSEHSTDIEPLRVGTDMVAGRLEALGLLAAWLVEDGEARGRLVAEADARLREQARLATGARALLDAACRVDSLAVPERAAADVRVANARMILSPSPSPLESIGADTALPEGLSLGDHRALRALKRQQLEIQAFRRQVAVDALAWRRPERPRDETLIVSRTSGWEKAEPHVTVIVPLYNDEEVVLAALDSVLASTIDSWELVVVDDASTDGGPSEILGWMDEHDDRAATLIRHDINRGLAAARNSGAEAGRGPLLMMLDSDNLLRPFGLARLIQALTRDPGAAFAFGILDRFLEEGPVGLVSNFGWEPARLRDGNYIDAMAMIRHGAFEQLGGYSEDPRLLLGYEDYDFWARLAEAGERGTMARQFVGSYRVGHSSMLSVTNISKVDAVAAISEHAPELMRGVELLG